MSVDAACRSNGILAGLKRRIRRQALHRELMSLDDRLLADIGKGHTITVKLPVGADVAAGATILLSWKAADCLAFAVSEAEARALQQASPE